MDPLTITDEDGDQMRLEELNGTGVYATGMVYLDVPAATQLRDWLNEWLDEQSRIKVDDRVYLKSVMLADLEDTGTVLATDGTEAWVEWDLGSSKVYRLSDLVRA